MRAQAQESEPSPPHTAAFRPPLFHVAAKRLRGLAGSARLGACGGSGSGSAMPARMSSACPRETVSSTTVDGSGGGPDTVFDVTVASPGLDQTLRYVTKEYDAPRNLLVVARSFVFTSIDRITVEPDGTGSVVTYDADLRLNGVLRVGDLGLRLMFGRIGDRAAAGLRRVLGGQAA